MKNRFATIISFIFMSLGLISIVWVGSSLSGKAFSQSPPPMPPQQQQQIPPPAMNLPPPQPGQPSPNQPMPQPREMSHQQFQQMQQQQQVPQQQQQAQPMPPQPQQVPPPPPGANLPPPDYGAPQPDDEGNYEDPNAQMPSAGLVEGQPILPGLNPDGYTYDPTGRRDPFMPYGATSVIPQPLPTGPTVPAVLLPPNENSLTFFELAQLRVTAIVWDVKDPKAMIIDPKGKLHMVHKDSPIGRNNGFVYAIREGEIVVIEPSLAENGAQTAVSRVMYLSGK